MPFVGAGKKLKSRVIVTCVLLAALFACSRLSYTLSVGTTGSGTGTFTTTGGNLTCSNDPTGQLSCGITYVPSQDEEPAPTLTIRAVASPDSMFLGWTGICMGTDTCTTTVDQDKKLSAQFVRVDYGTITRTDGSGNSIVTGTFYSSKTIGSTTLMSAGDVDVFVARYAAGSSTPTWAVRFGGQGVDLPQDLQVDANGDALLQITDRSPVILLGMTYTCSDPNQTLIIKLAGADGTVQWSRCLTP